METFSSTITLHDLTPAQFAAVANALNTPITPLAVDLRTGETRVIPMTGAPATETIPAPVATKPSRRNKSKAANPAPSTAGDTPPSHDLPLSESPASMEDLRKALSDLLAAKGMTECSQLLATFGATRIGELPVEKYAAVVAACKSAQA